MNIKNLEFKTITPEYAKRLLSNNYERNRNIRKSTVLQYARDMKNGNWVSDSRSNQIAPICISKKGKLLDGQHRLSAIVEANIPIKMYVQTDLEEESYKHMDNGIKRTAADVVTTGKNRATLASLLKSAYATKYGTFPIASCLQGKLIGSHPEVRVTRQDIADESVSCDADLYEECARLGKAVNASITKGGGSNYAYCIWLCKWLGRDDKLDSFVEELASTKPANDRNVELIKRTILTRYANKSAPSNSELVSIVLRGYEATRNNIQLERLTGTAKTLALYNSLVDSKREATTQQVQEEEHEIHNNEG